MCVFVILHNLFAEKKEAAKTLVDVRHTHTLKRWNLLLNFFRRRFDTLKIHQLHMNVCDTPPVAWYRYIYIFFSLHPLQSHWHCQKRKMCII